jgi:hypothetical protein
MKINNLCARILSLIVSSLLFFSLLVLSFLMFLFGSLPNLFGKEAMFLLFVLSFVRG